MSCEWCAQGVACPVLTEKVRAEYRALQAYIASDTWQARAGWLQAKRDRQRHASGREARLSGREGGLDGMARVA